MDSATTGIALLIWRICLARLLLKLSKLVCAMFPCRVCLRAGDGQWCKTHGKEPQSQAPVRHT